MSAPVQTDQPVQSVQPPAPKARFSVGMAPPSSATQAPSYHQTSLVQPVTARAGGPKEQEPVPVPVDDYALDDMSVEMEPEVEKVLTRVEEKVEIPEELRNIGVTHAGPATPVITEEMKKELELPLTNEKIYHGLGEPVVRSIRWLATWCVKQLKRVHLVIKNVNGHVVRVKATE